MNNEDIIRTIEVLIQDYQCKYNEEPKFIKMPLWVKNQLREYFHILLSMFDYSIENEDEDNYSIYGLKICETISINRLDEMEVF